MKYTAGLLDEIGIGGERVKMYNLSSAEGARFAEVCEEMTAAVTSLGPSPLKKGASQGETSEPDAADRTGAA